MMVSSVWQLFAGNVPSKSSMVPILRFFYLLKWTGESFLNINSKRNSTNEIILVK